MTDPVVDFNATLAAANITPDKPLYAILQTIHNSALQLNKRIDDLKPADIERAVKQSLMGLRPAFERHWRWQTRIYLAVAFVAGMSTSCVSNYASYAIGSASGRHDAAIWQSWWQSTCGVGSSNRVVVSGKQVCQVPIEQTEQRK